MRSLAAASGFVTVALVVCGIAAAPVLPVIDHAPVKVALPGQSVAVRARLLGPPPKSVVLFVAASRDATPFKIPMASSGAELYVATIPAAQLTGQSEVFYYLEARASDDTPVETPWYTVQIKGLSKETGAGQGPDAGGTQRSWVKPALIGGGLLAAGGIALAASSGGGGGDDDGGGGGTSPYAGSYTGTDTTCARAPDGTSSCQSSGVSITITEQGVVRSSDLRDGQDLEAAMSGDSFVLVATVNENGLTGSIQYVGTVIDRRIVGSIQGSASSTAGVTTYSGSFSAVR